MLSDSGVAGRVPVFRVLRTGAFVIVWFWPGNDNPPEQKRPDQHLGELIARTAVCAVKRSTPSVLRPRSPSTGSVISAESSNLTMIIL